MKWLFQVLDFWLEWDDKTWSIVVRQKEKRLAGPPPEYKPENSPWWPLIKARRSLKKQG
jgi:hypothetical protein